MTNHIHLTGFIPEVKNTPTLVSHLDCFDENDLLIGVTQLNDNTNKKVKDKYF